MTIKYPSIDQLKNTIRAVSDRTRYAGKTDEGVPIFTNAPLPTLKFNGTVKIHGTNAGIRYSSVDDQLVPQSRERDLTLTADNAGFYMYVMQHEELFKDICKGLLVGHADTVVIYGEWCGKGIQKGVAVSEVDKMFVLFGIRLINGETETWYDVNDINTIFGDEFSMDTLNEKRVFFITQFPSYTMEIDFDNPSSVQNKLVELTQAVEAECPVGKYFGVSGVGEGIVWSHNSDEYGFLQFKVKGDKHANSKVKTLAPIDEAAFAAVEDFVATYVTEARLEQGLHVMKAEKMLDITAQNVGEFLRWVTSDVIKEEQQSIIQNALDPKKIARVASNVARKWYFEKL